MIFIRWWFWQIQNISFRFAFKVAIAASAVHWTNQLEIWSRLSQEPKAYDRFLSCCNAQWQQIKPKALEVSVLSSSHSCIALLNSIVIYSILGSCLARHLANLCNNEPLLQQSHYELLWICTVGTWTRQWFVYCQYRCHQQEHQQCQSSPKITQCGPVITLPLGVSAYCAGVAQ